MIAVVVALIGLVGVGITAYFAREAKAQMVIVREENTEQHAKGQEKIDLLSLLVTDMHGDVREIGENVEKLDTRVTDIERKVY